MRSRASTAKSHSPPQLARSLHLTYAEKRIRFPRNGVGSMPRSAEPAMPQRGVDDVRMTAGSDVGVLRMASSTPMANSLGLKLWMNVAFGSGIGGPGDAGWDAGGAMAGPARPGAAIEAGFAAVGAAAAATAAGIGDCALRMIGAATPPTITHAAT